MGKAVSMTVASMKLIERRDHRATIAAVTAALEIDTQQSGYILQRPKAGSSE